MTVETAPRTTLLGPVTNAAVTSVLLPVMAAALVNVTVPVVAPPIAERPAAVALNVAASFIVTETAVWSAVIALKLAVATPLVTKFA